MAEKPIIFSTEMVRAILEGRKTMTRRVVKPQPSHDVFVPDEGFIHCTEDGTICGQYLVLNPPDDACAEVAEFPVKSRYKPGDVLWVREAWCKNENPNSPNYGGYEYYADYEGAHCQSLIKWRSPIHMPRKAARIFLKVKNIQVERLQDITEEDAEAEGAIDWICQQHNNGTWIDNAMRGAACAKPKRAFALLWNSIYEKHFGWDQNPWVWVIEFEKVEPEI